jgi:glyoxylate utilization-related uncharacterized protein
MTATYVQTEQCPRVRLGETRGTVAEIVGQGLCGAAHFVGMLRWLSAGERFEPESLADKHQLIYLMDGNGVITLENKEYEVYKGAGIYLGPRETASIRQSDSAPLKLLHLIVNNPDPTMFEGTGAHL